MQSLLRQIISVVLGLVVGSAVNMSLITLSPMLIPPPAGVDVTTMEGLQKSIHLFGPQHFVMPFLAHALGTFAGALVASLIALTNRLRLALLVGIFFMIGGIAAVNMIPAPLWYNVVDLVFAYIPMALAGWSLAVRIKPNLAV